VAIDHIDQQIFAFLSREVLDDPLDGAENLRTACACDLRM